MDDLSTPDFPVIVADELGVVDRYATIEEALTDYPEAVPFKGSSDKGFTYWNENES